LQISSVLLYGPSGSGKTLLVERLCQAHGIILDKLEPAKVFLQGGMWTVAEYIERHLMQVSLQAGAL
jgi:ATP-dependent protease Clp ATPase subunit